MKVPEFPTYDAYKDSGVEWLGRIPAHWDVVPNRGLLTEQREKVGKKSKDYTLLSLTLKGVIPRDMENPQGKFPAEFNTYTVVNPEDLIFCLFDIDETPRAVGYSAHHGMITGAYNVYQPTKLINSRYLYYYYLYLDQGKRLKPLYSGLRKTIQRGTFASAKSPLPPKPEQDRIVAFLDRKTAEIDELIAKKKRQIELLEEQKAILINRAVTRGLNPDVKLKPSGIDWIGEIPEEWEVKRFRYLYRSVSRWDRDGTEEKLSVTQKNGLVKTSEMLENSTQAVSFDGFQLCHPGDLVLNKYKAHLGVFWASDVRGIISNNYTVLGQIANVNPSYVETLFHTSLYKWKFSTVVYGIVEGMMPLYTKDLYGVETIFPPRSEQDAIMEYCAAIANHCRNAAKAVEMQILSLKIFRSTLIAHAATGRIKIL